MVRAAIRMILSIIAALALSLLLHNFLLDALLPDPSQSEIQDLQRRFAGGDSTAGLGAQVIFFEKLQGKSGALTLPDDRLANQPETLSDIKTHVTEACGTPACYGAVVLRAESKGTATLPAADEQPAPTAETPATAEPASEAAGGEEQPADGENGTDTQEGEAPPSDATPTSLGSADNNAQQTESGDTPAGTSQATAAATLKVGDVAIFSHWRTYLLWPDSIQIEHSIHSFARLVERTVFNPASAGPADLMLCSGTLKLLPPANCRDVELATDRLSAEIEHKRSFDDIERAMSYRAMEQGPIQFIIITWALLCIILMLFVPGFSLRSKRPDEVSLTDAHDRIKRRLEKSGTRGPAMSIEDRVILPALIASSGGTPLTKGELLDDIERSRIALRSQVEDTFEFASRTAEHLLKAALFGTALGISTAIFESRGTQSADIVQSMVVQAKMLSSLALGFGTTILGVVGSGLITEVRGWRMDQLLDQIDDAVARWNTSVSGMTQIPPQSELPKSAIDATRPLPGSVIFGGTFLFFTLLFVIAWLYFMK